MSNLLHALDMAEMIPLRFKRATATLDHIARARLYDCSSTSGSEHSAANGSVELGDLVLSYLESECEEDVDCRGSRDDDDIQLGSDDGVDDDDDDKVEDTESKKKKKNGKHINGTWSDPDQVQIETLRSLLHVGDKDAKAIQATVEAAIRAVPSVGKDGRGLMSELRRRGLDAGTITTYTTTILIYPHVVYATLYLSMLYHLHMQLN